MRLRVLGRHGEAHAENIRADEALAGIGFQGLGTPLIFGRQERGNSWNDRAVDATDTRPSTSKAVYGARGSRCRTRPLEVRLCRIQRHALTHHCLQTHLTRVAFRDGVHRQEPEGPFSS